MKKIYQKNKFPVWLFIIAFIIRMIVITILKTPIESDFKTMYEASLEIIKGTKNYLYEPYFINWGYQMGHVLYQVILLKIINSVYFLKVVNCLVTSLITVMIYLITKQLTNKSSAKIASIIYAVFPFPLLMNAVLTNQHLPILLILIAVYILMNIDYNKNVIIKSIIIGLLLGLSNILRSEGIVIIFSILMYHLVLILKKINIKKVSICFVIILTSYLLIGNATSLVLQKTSLSINGLKNMNPYWKFVLGFNYETSGMYSEKDAIICSGDKEKAIEITKERIKEYKKIPILFAKKHKILWLNSDLYWPLGYIANSNIYKITNIINQIFIYILYFSSVLSTIILIKNKFEQNQFLITMILATYAGVYLLIEVMPRYAYSIQVFEAILLGITINFLIKKLKFRINKK